ncbi:Uu.00g107950.m01.CDS01 [Anthostomella pinea]|uniref:nitric oxide dioxygenase n=1 Tax=Anthostomella pinea TaxID=933095 RepID=A0AAI8YDL7_9PEZI|nr:Uu.00g107950.m01.CDS01 [Anthostomella pinea]
MALSRQEAELVKETIPALRHHGEHISTVFYKTMLREHPELNNYFNTVNMQNGKQPRALTALILAFASNIVNISELGPKMERVAQKHASLNIQPGHYEIVGKYLLRAFSAVLGPAMTADVKQAWQKAYWQMAKMLTGREVQIYRDFAGWTGWRKFRIFSKNAETKDGDIVSLSLRPVDSRPLPTFMPGQYVTMRLRLPDLKYTNLRQYSLSSAPRPDQYRVTVKRDMGTDRDFTTESPRSSMADDDDPPKSSAASSASDSSIGSIRPHKPGLVSNTLIDEFKVGDLVELTHPAGEFFLDTADPSTTPLVLISAGVCASPLFSILDTVTSMKVNRPVSWIQGSRHDAPFQQQVEAIAAAHPNVRTKFFRSRLADSDVLSYTSTFKDDFQALLPADLCLDSSLAQYYICGPEKFMLEISALLQKYGVDTARVRFELHSVGYFEVKSKNMA